jgi:trk system potassium uptake protein TrkH
MSLPAILRFLGVLLVWTAVAMVPPAILAAGDGLLLPWAGAVAVTALLGGSLWLSTPSQVVIDQRAGLVVVGLGWLGVVTVGSLPFVFTGVAPDLASSLFESVSGFTTTGATVFPVIESLPRSILLWRSISHWLGGMGIIVLGVAILPFLGVGGAQLFHAEAPGISTDRLTPRIASTARLLWAVYGILTTALAVIYLALGMSFFDAINHAMSALATGGFSTRSESLGAFSPAIQWITVAFMLIAGTNFALHYRLLTGRWSAWLRDAEWRVYVGFALVVAIICFVALGFSQGSWRLDGLRDASFNVVAVISTTGFSTADFAAWPTVCQVLLLALMFIGASGGSTGGGFKVVRAVVLAKHTLGSFRLALHPRAVIVTRLGRKAVRPEVLLKVVGFFALFVATHGLGTIILAALGHDFVTSTSAALAAMSSIGPGLGAVGPASHYGDMGSAAHLTLTALMLLGRLEFYTLLVLVLPGTWALARRTRNGPGQGGRTRRSRLRIASSPPGEGKGVRR